MSKPKKSSAKIQHVNLDKAKTKLNLPNVGVIKLDDEAAVRVPKEVAEMLVNGSPNWKYYGEDGEEETNEETNEVEEEEEEPKKEPGGGGTDEKEEEKGNTTDEEESPVGEKEEEKEAESNEDKPDVEEDAKEEKEEEEPTGDNEEEEESKEKSTEEKDLSDEDMAAMLKDRLTINDLMGLARQIGEIPNKEVKKMKEEALAKHIVDKLEEKQIRDIIKQQDEEDAKNKVKGKKK